MHLRLQDKGGLLTLSGQRIKVTLADGALQYFPVHGLQTIVVGTDYRLDTNLLRHCMDNDLSIVIDSDKYNPICLQGHSHFSARTGIKQAGYRISQDLALAFTLACFIVNHKITQQRRTILHLSKEYQINNMDIAKTVTYQHSTVADNKQQLLGVEGAASASYFRALKYFIPNWCAFSKRQRRPPPDPANAMLSLVYTLATQLISRELFKAGFEPLFGVLHQPCDYRHSLSCDLVEVFRADLDKWVLCLLHNTLSRDHFGNDPTQQAALLNNSGKQLFYPAWFVYQKRLRKKIQRLLRVIKREVISCVPT